MTARVYFGLVAHFAFRLLTESLVELPLLLMLICPSASASFICRRSAFVRKADYKPTCPHLASRSTVAIEPLHSESKPVPHVVQPARASLARGGTPFVLGSLGQVTQNRHTGLGHVPITVDTVAGSGTRLSGGAQSPFFTHQSGFQPCRSAER